MYPVNQVFLGTSDPLLSQDNINSQIQLLKQYEAQLSKLQAKGTLQTELIWDKIDNEMNFLTETQKLKFFENEEYAEITKNLQEMVQIELLNLVKAKIENTEKGKDLLEKQFKLVKKLKSKIVEDTNNEIAIFNKFKEYSKNNPNLTYEEFIKEWRNT